MDVAAFGADGGPYVVEVHCPEGVPLLLADGILGLFGFGGVYGRVVLSAWPALFLSLGRNFLEYALRPPAGERSVWGRLIPGVLFVIMGGVPLLVALPIGDTGRAGRVRERMAGR